MTSLVREIPAAPSAIALMHFSNRLTFETDCSDVHGSQAAGEVDFILLDVRGPLAFERGHVPGAINVPRRLLSAEGLAAYPKNTLFVVYLRRPSLQWREQGSGETGGTGLSGQRDDRWRDRVAG